MVGRTSRLSQCEAVAAHWVLIPGRSALGWPPSIEGAVALDVEAVPTAILREDLVSLSDFRSRTHPEFRPADATRCHSLLLAGRAILGADLHEWLFLLVTA